MAKHEHEEIAKLHIAMVRPMAGLRSPYSFISTPTNIHRLPKIPLTLANSLHRNQSTKISPITYAESTKHVPSNKVKHLKIAFDLLPTPIADWIIFDLVEGLQVGKPLVLLPLLLDQGVIASYLVEKRVGCVIDRDDGDGSFTPESVADSLSLVMVREEGKMYRDKAKEMMGVFGDTEAQDKCVDQLIHFLSK